jgi:hypothetical protein
MELVKLQGELQMALVKNAWSLWLSLSIAGNFS